MKQLTHSNQILQSAVLADLPSHILRTFIYLVNHSNNKQDSSVWRVWHSQNQIAKHFKYATAKPINKHIKILAELGYIVISKARYLNKGKFLHNVYTINLSALGFSSVAIKAPRKKFKNKASKILDAMNINKKRAQKRSIPVPELSPLDEARIRFSNNQATSPDARLILENDHENLLSAEEIHSLMVIIQGEF